MNDKKISPKNLAMAAGLGLFIAVTFYKQFAAASIDHGSEVAKHTSGMSLLDKLDADKSPEVKEDPIALAAAGSEKKIAGEGAAEKSSSAAINQEAGLKEAEKTPGEPCEDYQFSLGKCKKITVAANTTAETANVQPPKEASTSGSEAKKSPENQPQDRPSQKSSNAAPHTALAEERKSTPEPAQKSSLSAWAKMNSGEIKTLKGKSSYYSSDAIRAGCRVLAVIEDELMVAAGEKHLLTLNVRGPLDGCKLPAVDGLRLIAYAQLNNLENGILANVTKCADRTPDRKTQECKARVKSITGRDSLEGEIYDKSGWGILFEFLMATGSAPVVAKLTETAASAKTIWGAEAAGMVAASVQRSLDRVSGKIAKAFEGRMINLAGGAYVIVTFEEDVVL